jgi:lipopolysaccharide transport system permease protein
MTTTVMPSRVGPVTWRAALDPVATLRHFYRHRELLWQLVKRDVQQRYRASHLGLLWSVLTPLSTLVIYTFVFSTVLKARWRPEGSSTIEFALALFAGLIPFTVFAEVANRAPGLVPGSPNYVKKVIFPLDILPIVTLGSAAIHSLISAAILTVLVTLVTGDVAPRLMAVLPLAYLPLVFLALGVGWLLAALGAYVRDIGHGVGIAVQFLMFLSPIVYPLHAVPEAFRPLFTYNPMTTIVEVFRTLLLWHDWPDWRPWLLCTIGTGIFAWFGHVWFTHLRRGFADVI